jgi:hypothetical protein
VVSRRQLPPALLRGYLSAFTVLAVTYVALEDPPRVLWTVLSVMGVAACVTGAALQPTR